MRVIIGTDGSDDAIAAAVSGLQLMAAPDDVTIVCVVDAPVEATAGLESGFAGGLATDAEVDAAWAAVKSEAGEALEQTAGAVTAALGSSATVNSEVRRGDAGSVLCELAGELDADAVIVGSRGRGAIKRALLGSVSTHVVNNAPCPVVVVRAGTD